MKSTAPARAESIAPSAPPVAGAAGAAAPAGRSLAELEDEWRRRFVYQPKLPTAALLSGAVAMALGFGTVMFLAFAAAARFRSAYTAPAALCAALALCAGLLNRLLARRWFKAVQAWSAEREALQQELERARAAPRALPDKPAVAQPQELERARAAPP